MPAFTFQQYIQAYKSLSVQSADKVTQIQVNELVTPEQKVAELPVILPAPEHEYSTKVQSEPLSIDNIIRIDNRGKNLYKGKQAIFASDRIIFDARADYLILSSKRGTAIASAGPVHIDTPEECVFNPVKGIFLGKPKINNNTSKNQQNSDSPPDQKYEPLILGNKLANILDEIISTLSTLLVNTPTGEGQISAKTQNKLQKIAAKIPEILSTYAFVDGTKHDTALSSNNSANNSTSQQATTQQANQAGATQLQQTGSGDFTFIDPLQGQGKITSIPGNRINPVTNLPQNHGGLDMASSRGTPIYAIADGTVLRLNNGCVEGDKQCGGNLGNYVVVKHVGDIETKYGHMQLNSIAVQVGDEIKQGQLIGMIGNTGSSSGPHLHLQMKALPGSQYSDKVMASAPTPGLLNPLDFINVT